MKRLVFLVLLSFSLCCCKQKARLENFYSTVGLYRIDIKRTDLGEYSRDSLIYKDLKVEFLKDSTFKFNMNVPFIYEDRGKWLSDGGDFESWNWLSYQSWLNDDDLVIGKGNQFTAPYIDKNDTILYINGATSKDNKAFIQEIYFIKVTSKLKDNYHLHPRTKSGK